MSQVWYLIAKHKNWSKFLFIVSNACKEDLHCDTANCFYCLSNGKCGKYDSEYCDKDGVVCGQGDGDCDSTCPSGFKCGRNNFLQYHPRLSHCSGTSSAEVCTQGGKFIH